MASSEPCTSALMMSGNSLRPDGLELRHHLLERAAHAGVAGGASSRASGGRGSRSVRGRAPRSRPPRAGRSLPACRRSPAPRPEPRARPPATDSPLSLTSARTRPHSAPATMMSPICSVPRWTSTVATGPRPRSSLASITVPSAARDGLALRSRISACSPIISSSLSRLVFLVADTSTSTTSPPSDSTCTSCCSSSVRTRSGLASGLVDLVDGDDHRHLRRLGVIDRLDRLRHHAVVGGDHQHDDVGDLGAAGAHRREGGVARRVDEGDLAVRRRVHLIGADVLGDAAGFAADHIGRADGVEQRGLAVVDVTHDGHDRRARLERRRIVGDVEHAFLDVGFGDALDGVAEFLGDELGGVGVDHVVDRRHLALLHQDLDDVDRALGHAVGELLDGDRLRDRHFADELFLRLVALSLRCGAARGGGTTRPNARAPRRRSAR